MRRTKTVTISAPGRDQGKTFFLTEMPAARSERWAVRAFLGLAKSGIEIPDDIADAGLAGIAALGIKAIGNIAFAEAQPLLDEMFACIAIIPDTKHPDVKRSELVDEDIEEISTRLTLRREVFALHVDFSQAATLFRSAPGGSAAASDSRAT